MIRIYRRSVISNVTGHAGLVQTVIDAACMAAVARQRCMAARKRELCVRRVIEACPLPGRGRVAYRAILRQSSGYMIRILRSVVINEVTRRACLIQSIIHSALVTAVTG